MNTNLRIHLLCVTALLLVPLSSFSQGRLDPTTGPAPTMKTLDEVEARIPINATNTPGNENAHFVITQRGSYYLTGNISATKPTAIYISVVGVTLDLNGFMISRSGAPAGTGILLNSANRIVVRNGFIQNFGKGIDFETAANAHDGAYVDLVVTNCADDGLYGGRDWIVDRCVVANNGSTGIIVGDGSRVSRSVARGNGLGIFANNSTITGCSASGNKGDGIRADSGSCVSDSVARSNGRAGIFNSGGATISRCSASANVGPGIVAGSESLVLNNDCVGNGTGSLPAAGIRVQGSGSRIDSNNTANNDIGIQVADAGNIIIKNSSRGGTTAYSIATGNSMGQEINVFNASTTTVINNSNPWANFSY